MIPTIKAVCQQCGKEFEVSPAHFAELGFRAFPKRCPTCIDKAQARPSVVQERELLNVYDGVEILSLPASWKPVETGVEGDVPSYKITVKGRWFGANWSGRIDLFANQKFGEGDVVSIREMETKHLIKIVKERMKTFRYGEVQIDKEVPITSEEGEEVVRSRRYLILEPYEGEATAHLVWVMAKTKTTLSGAGRQYWADLGGAPIAMWTIQGGYRSGRAHTVGALAIVNASHPLYLTMRGDIKKEEVYT